MKKIKDYLEKFFLFDLLAWLTVSFAALSLWAAFGVQSWLWAFAWMLWAAIIPIVASTFWWTKIQASWPTAPMTAVSMLVIWYAFNTFGNNIQAMQFITLVFLLTWLFLILFWIFRLWNLINKIPHLVIIWFMDWIAILIWLDQFKKLFWLFWKNIITWSHIWNIFFALITFVFILLFPKLIKKIKLNNTIKSLIPTTLIAIIVFTLIINIFWLDLEKVSLWRTISSLGWFINQIYSYFPSKELLYNKMLLFKALWFGLQLAILAYLDSLLTSVIIDKMTKLKTKRNKELIAQWLANGISWLLWWLPWAQATIRSVLLIKEWAKTRLAGIFVWIFTLLWILIFKNFITYIPLTIFIWILFKVWLDVFDLKYLSDFIKNKRYKNKFRIIQFIFVVYTILITVFVNLNTAVISATIIFYLFKYFNIIKDIEVQEDTTEEKED